MVADVLVRLVSWAPPTSSTGAWPGGPPPPGPGPSSIPLADKVGGALRRLRPGVDRPVRLAAHHPHRRPRAGHHDLPQLLGPAGAWRCRLVGPPSTRRWCRAWPWPLPCARPSTPPCGVADVLLWVAVLFTLVSGLQYALDGHSSLRTTGRAVGGPVGGGRFDRGRPRRREPAARGRVARGLAARGRAVRGLAARGRAAAGARGSGPRGAGAGGSGGKRGEAGGRAGVPVPGGGGLRRPAGARPGRWGPMPPSAPDRSTAPPLGRT